MFNNKIKFLLAILFSVFVFYPNISSAQLSSEIYSFKRTNGDIIYTTLSVASNKGHRGAAFDKVYENGKNEPAYYMYFKADTRIFRNKKEVVVEFSVNGEVVDLQPYMIKKVFDNTGSLEHVYKLPKELVDVTLPDVQVNIKYIADGEVLKELPVDNRHLIPWQKVKELTKENYLREGLFVNSIKEASKREGALYMYFPETSYDKVLKAVIYNFKKKKPRAKRYGHWLMWAENKDVNINQNILFEGFDVDAYKYFSAVPHKNGSLFRVFDRRGKNNLLLNLWEEVFFDICEEFGDTANYGIEFKIDKGSGDNEGNVFNIISIDKNMKEQYLGIKVDDQIISINDLDIEPMRTEEIKLMLMQAVDGAKIKFKGDGGKLKEIFVRPIIKKGNPNGEIDYDAYFADSKNPIKLKVKKRFEYPKTWFSAYTFSKDEIEGINLLLTQ
ncbi:MAG TPA: PDZ domain-containing protein [Candidatus Avacidaminococcus intestinavium]|uniref:PDZ domain-containing protein n=1 Tax=Candidatus Avacidaminococcus intestinavium TaxID=2840684 RepID=A0A9D1SLW7_9FIRM|nr:PDZ domain-containing protein [Candidatus Avacidaminococcus intestinavium]